MEGFENEVEVMENIIETITESPVETVPTKGNTILKVVVGTAIGAAGAIGGTYLAKKIKKSREDKKRWADIKNKLDNGYEFVKPETVDSKE